MPAVVVVVEREVPQQLVQVIQSADDGDAREPFVLQGQDDALADRDRAVFAHRTEAVLDVPAIEEVGDHLGDEDFFLVADEVPGSPVLSKRFFHRVHYPTGVRSFQGYYGHHRAGEVSNGDQHPGGPQSPAQHPRSLHAPHVVGVAGDDLSGCGGRLLGLGYSSTFRTVEAATNTPSSQRMLAIR